jgi:chromosome segregation ATPase
MHRSVSFLSSHSPSLPSWSLGLDGGDDGASSSSSSSSSAPSVQRLLGPFLPSPLTPELAALMERLYSSSESLESLSQAALQQSRENLELNACKRQLNGDIAAIEKDLKQLDGARLTISNQVNDAQGDFNILNNKEKDLLKKLEVASVKMTEASRRYEELVGTLSGLQSDVEKAKEQVKALQDDLTYNMHLDKVREWDGQGERKQESCDFVVLLC